MAHPIAGDRAAVVTRSIEETSHRMGADREAWRSLVEPLVSNWDRWTDIWLGPVLRVPRHPVTMVKAAQAVLRPAVGFANGRFEDEEAKAAFAGFAAHSIAPLEGPLTAAAGTLFNAALHAVGMPFAKGGSQAIADALVSVIRGAGGEVRTESPVSSLSDLPPARVILFDVNPAQALAIGGDRIKPRLRRAFRRFRHGSGSFKVDVALDGPVPWAAEECRRAGTVHVGGTLAEVAEAERLVGAGQHPEHPFLIAAQPTICDPRRAPAGRSILWAYCHVPAGSTVDMTEPILNQVERFAPGFRDRILHCTSTSPADFEQTNRSMVGGDIAGGRTEGLGLVFRPTITTDPWRIGDDLYLCSQSTPPGTGVHGMCGWWAATTALRDLGKTVT